MFSNAGAKFRISCFVYRVSGKGTAHYMFDFENLDVYRLALDFAKKVKAEYVLFDTAPGIHCPVVSALLDCDLAYCVTEPTPMGAHDLNLILDLCKKLKVPTKVILNQADLGDKRKIFPIVKKYKIKIEKEIPYSKKLVEAYSKGQLLNFII